MINVSSVSLPPETEELVLEVLRSGMIAQGPRVAELEEAFAAVCGVPHAVAVNNGTTALVAALQALDLRPGDEVVTTPFSFVATLNAILEAGATVRFADVLDDFTIDPAAVGALVGERTRAIIPVHLYGLPADMAALEALALPAGVALVEDAAQAVGARFGGRPVGSFGLGCFSLYATKNVTSGEGGMVTTADDGLADRLRLLRNQGMRRRYAYEIPGHNYRMTDLQAAVALPQMARLKEINDRRAGNARELTAGLEGIAGLVLPAEVEGRSHVWHQYTVRVTPDARLTRDELAARLAEAGVGTGVYYPRLMHDYPCYQGHPLIRADGGTPRAASLVHEVLSLPVHPALSDADLRRVTEAVRSLLGED
ncbi:DegT/DnrJ/EryC1/StrS family aminotransferase [Planomonospora sp. ID67723]|uniref:DegT/DnrJ/EryC1/StrS family aminotransferase n=1 Tax=Planomonospora sp. ID67723 TaxID=2738134 RepID=UPI0018C406C3|nr:DegT/DnrJ/EryC1/StrS family aminotransferase [Planomonospora sp. ID67723]MBG0827445.1 DegT/DnrJ/EryC1/StrS family aminotransferase [Planomonospora sp. ID67723]